jgi:hypothetical protein
MPSVMMFRYNALAVIAPVLATARYANNPGSANGALGSQQATESAAAPTREKIAWRWAPRLRRSHRPIASDPRCVVLRNSSIAGPPATYRRQATRMHSRPIVSTIRTPRRRHSLVEETTSGQSGTIAQGQQAAATRKTCCSGHHLRQRGGSLRQGDKYNGLTADKESATGVPVGDGPPSSGSRFTHKSSPPMPTLSGRRQPFTPPRAGLPGTPRRCRGHENFTDPVRLP